MRIHNILPTFLGICAAGFVLWLAMGIGGDASLIEQVRDGHIRKIPAMNVDTLVRKVSNNTALWTLDETRQPPLATATWTKPDGPRVRLEFSMEPDGPVILERVLYDDTPQGWMAKGRFLDAFTRLARGESPEQAFRQ